MLVKLSRKTKLISQFPKVLRNPNKIPSMKFLFPSQEGKTQLINQDQRKQ